MPYLIKTPEDVFRETGKDVYLIRFCENRKKKHAATEEVQAWIQENLPGTRVEPLAPSEHSGWISGYFGDLWIDFSAEGLAAFCARWEDAEGKSIDPRFQCYLVPYQRWYDRHGRFVPTREPPTSIGMTVWIDTPIGFIYHRLDDDEAARHGWTTHPATARDLWMHAVRLWPALTPVELSKLDRGAIFPDTERPGNWLATFDAGFGYARTDDEIAGRMQVVRAWFHLPDAVEFVSTY